MIVAKKIIYDNPIFRCSKYQSTFNQTYFLIKIKHFQKILRPLFMD